MIHVTWQDQLVTDSRYLVAASYECLSFSHPLQKQNLTSKFFYAAAVVPTAYGKNVQSEVQNVLHAHRVQQIA
jgi:hypothetical protein